MTPSERKARTADPNERTREIGEREVWRDVENWPYEVSSLGRVRRTKPANGATVGRVLKLGRSTRGYATAQLSSMNKQRTFSVHRLVAFAFLGEPPDGHEINHIDGDKQNNAVANLEWVTSSQNKRHAVREWGYHTGEKNGRSKFTERDALWAISVYKGGGVTQQQIADKLGVTRQCIGDVIKGRRWGHLRAALVEGAQDG